MGDAVPSQSIVPCRPEESAWHMRAVCRCGWHTYCTFGKVFHVHREVCPRCGCRKIAWRVKVMRWRSDTVWYRPSTWCTGEWEDQPDA